MGNPERSVFSGLSKKIARIGVSTALAVVGTESLAPTNKSVAGALINPPTPVVTPVSDEIYGPYQWQIPQNPCRVASIHINNQPSQAYIDELLKQDGENIYIDPPISQQGLGGGIAEKAVINKQTGEKTLVTLEADGNCNLENLKALLEK